MGKGGGKGKVRRREKKERGKDREKGNEANRKGEEKNGKAVAPKERETGRGGTCINNCSPNFSMIRILMSPLFGENPPKCCYLTPRTPQDRRH